MTPSMACSEADDAVADDLGRPRQAGGADRDRVRELCAGSSARRHKSTSSTSRARPTTRCGSAITCCCSGHRSSGCLLGTVNGMKSGDVEARMTMRPTRRSSVRTRRSPLDRRTAAGDELNARTGESANPRTAEPANPRSSEPANPRTRSRRGVRRGRYSSQPLAGLVRLQVFAHYFGLESDAADAFNAAFRIPNFLQNLFGEGALSASFIPVYASLVARGERKDADRVAGAVGALLALVVAILVLVRRARDAAADRRHCAGIHRREARADHPARSHPLPGRGAARAVRLVPRRPEQPPPVPAVVCRAGDVERRDDRDARRSSAPRPRCRGSPCCWRGDRSSAASCSSRCRCRSCCASRRICGSRSTSHPRHVRIVARNFVPVFISRGVVQVSAYIDALLASLLPTGAVTGIANAQLLYTLPVSLFGMSVAAAELPTMSGEASADAQGYELLRRAARRAAFGASRSSSCRRRWRFSRSATCWSPRCCRRDASVTRTPSTSGASSRARRSGCSRRRSGGSTPRRYYALRDTRTPLRFAIVRVVLTTRARLSVRDPAAASARRRRRRGAPPGSRRRQASPDGWRCCCCGRTMNARIGKTGLPASYVVKLWTRGDCRRGRCVGCQALNPDAAAGRCGDPDHRPVRSRVPCDDAGIAGRRSRADIANHLEATIDIPLTLSSADEVTRWDLGFGILELGIASDAARG